MPFRRGAAHIVFRRPISSSVSPASTKCASSSSSASSQCRSIGGRGQVYVLDMGEPVKITDLAETMIRLSGKEPERDIAIEFVGPAPGEKLHEELVGDGEVVSASPYPKIDLITRSPVDSEWLESELALLERLVSDGETLELVGALRRLVEEPKRARSGATVS